MSVRMLVFILVLLLSGEREARAYTDPGSGALLWQMLAGGLVGILFYVRQIASRFRFWK